MNYRDSTPSLIKPLLIPGLALFFAAFLLSCAAEASPGGAGAEQREGEVLLATTTSLQDSGLLDVLLPMFESRSGYRVKPVSVGTGAALEMGARGDVDVVLVHAPEAEKAWMAEGYGTERLLVMVNDFVIVGPAGDPAGVADQPSAVAALEAVARQGARWISRDDNSGTHQLEQQLWAAAGIAPGGEPWFVASGQGMGGTLTIADQQDAYTLSDRGTYLSRLGTLQSEILFQGDPALLNFYHVMPVNPDKFPSVAINLAGASAFAEFLLSAEAQQAIAAFGADEYHQPLFIPTGGKTEEQVKQGG